MRTNNLNVVGHTPYNSKTISEKRYWKHFKQKVLLKHHVKRNCMNWDLWLSFPVRMSVWKRNKGLSRVFPLNKALWREMKAEKMGKYWERKITLHSELHSAYLIIDQWNLCINKPARFMIIQRIVCRGKAHTSMLDIITCSLLFPRWQTQGCMDKNIHIKQTVMSAYPQTAKSIIFKWTLVFIWHKNIKGGVSNTWKRKENDHFKNLWMHMQCQF